MAPSVVADRDRGQALQVLLQEHGPAHACPGEACEELTAVSAHACWCARECVRACGMLHRGAAL